jgi:hypothetical protein
MARTYHGSSGKKSSPLMVVGVAILAIGLARGAAGGASATTVSAVGGATSSGANQTIGQQLAAQHGWTGGQWNCLNMLWTRESGWQMVWNTAGSGAYGIPQSLPASKMASAGADYMTNPATEIKWGLGYIQSTYGDPCTAWAHETANSWY